MILKNKLSLNSGILEADIKAILKSASKNNVVIMFRSSGPFVRYWLSRGHPSKNFHIKGKSSDIGMLAGLIPYSAKYSKQWYDLSKAEKSTEANNLAIEKNFAQKEQFYILHSQLENIIENYNSLQTDEDLYLQKYSHNPLCYQVKKTFIKNKEELEKIFYFKLEEEIGGCYEVSIGEKKRNNKIEFEPVDVMSSVDSKTSQSFFTGDYDLFAVCPRYGDFGEDDVLINPSLSPKGTTKPEFSRFYQRKDSFEYEERFPKVFEDKDLGNISKRIKSVIADLTLHLEKVCAGDIQLENTRVHHNADQGNPFADSLENCFPISFFLPECFKESFERLNRENLEYMYGTLENKKDLQDFMDILYESEFIFERNYLWKLDSSFFDKRKEELEKNLLKIMRIKTE